METAPLSNTVRPTVVGTPNSGETLIADEGAWSSTPDEFAYQWYVNGVAVADATAKTWLVSESTAGQAAQVFIGATKAGHTPAYALSTGSAPIEPTATTPPPAPVALQNTVGVSISGTPTVDETLTAVEGTWDPEATSHLYQWYLNGIPVDGATSQTWVVPASAEVRPSMSPAPAVVSFRWLRDGKPTRYATANRYRIRYRDRGHVIRLRVSYARDYYATVRKVTNGKVIR